MPNILIMDRVDALLDVTPSCWGFSRHGVDDVVSTLRAASVLICKIEIDNDRLAVHVAVPLAEPGLQIGTASRPETWNGLQELQRRIALDVARVFYAANGWQTTEGSGSRSLFVLCDESGEPRKA